MKTIKIDQTWSFAMSVYIAALQDGNVQGKKQARQALMDLAKDLDKPKEHTKVCLVIEDGNLNEIISNDKDLKVAIVDYDRLEMDEDNAALWQIQKPDTIVPNMFEAFKEIGDKKAMDVRADLKRRKF